MATRSSPGSVDPRYVAAPAGSIPGVAGRASVSCKDLYSRTRSRSLRRPPPAGGCGWYEYGLYDVALELTEVPLRPFELEYRERTILTPEEPQPIELPSTRQPPVLVKLKHKPRACAPPHPSTVRLRYEPEAAPVVFPTEGHKKQQKTDKIEKQPSTQIHKEAESSAAKERHKTEKGEKHEKADKGDKGDKQEKGEKQNKEKSEKKEKEKKKNKDQPQEQPQKEDS
ncbi:uncharacterized protein EMH_0026490 [Eimeria mitis]|uniref:Uncharacterized protein n=1 Tax=Eimeria mitis TaxID=44415 RepID=U6KJ64_9EIME|nr:uncharacterized protein EMH_0026490 [Eimeria mitis]CDJ35493.1 hypothetical protein, conserved [Eimeria mitis]